MNQMKAATNCATTTEVYKRRENWSPMSDDMARKKEEYDSQHNSPGGKNIQTFLSEKTFGKPQLICIGENYLYCLNQKKCQRIVSEIVKLTLNLK